MKRFVFRLQTALDLRRRKEELLRAELARLQERARLEKERLDNLYIAQADAMERAAQARVGPIVAEQAFARARHLMDLEDGIETQTRLVELTQSEVDRKMAEVVHATQETRALEKLRERHLEDHRKLELQEEQKFLDELASIKAARSMR
ncbi:MAG TPA: flagellar export protein FliJ [Armatimonadota bacterium]|jgi:flagellar FliJ protein